jgi:hypothetical protein
MIPPFSYQFELKTLYCFCYPPIHQKHKKVSPARFVYINKNIRVLEFDMSIRSKKKEFDMSNFLNLLWFELNVFLYSYIDQYTMFSVNGQLTKMPV